MASLPQNMRKGVKYYVALKKGMIVGRYEGLNYDGSYMFLSDGEIRIVPRKNVVGVSAAKS